MCVIYILHSREPSLRLTISQAVFFSSVLCSSLLRHFDTAHKGYRCLLYSSSSNMIFQIYWVYYVAFLRRKKKTGLTSCWLRANTWKSSIKRQKKRCQDDSISQFIYFKLAELKSDNLQYNTLVCWADGTNNYLTKRLTFQVFFFILGI